MPNISDLFIFLNIKMGIYKIRRWVDNKPKLYILTGQVPDNINKIFEKVTKKTYKLSDANISVLEKYFGSNYNNELGLDLDIDRTFLPVSINYDDNINIITKKLVIYLELHNPDDIYLWIHKKIHNNTILLSFIQNCFKSNDTIQFSYFKTCVYNFFDGINIENNDFNLIDKDLALKILSQLNIKTLVEPLQFKYAYDNYFEYIQYNPLKKNTDDISTFTINTYSSLLLSSLIDINETTIDIITIDDVTPNIRKIFFPYHSNKSPKSFSNFIKILNNIDDQINKHSFKHKFGIDTFVTFLYLKGNENTFNKKVNLSLLFDTYHTSDLIVFIKLKTISNIYYKINKKSLISIHKNLDKWTLFNSKNITTSISFKLRFGDTSYCTFIVYDNLAYDVKFNISIDEKASIKQVNDFYDNVNKILTNITKLYPDSYVPLLTNNSVSILNIVTYNILSIEKKSIKFDNIEQLINDKFYPYFNIIQGVEKNILQLQYKKIDNYIKFNDVQIFITHNFSLSKDELISQIMIKYSLSKDDAEKEYDKWANDNQIELYKKGDKIVAKPRYDTILTIKLKINEIINAKFITSGLKDFYTLDKIIFLMKVLLDLANQKIVKSTTSVDINSFDNQMFIKNTDNNNFNSIGDINKESEYDQDEIDPDFMELEQEFKELEQKQSVKPQSIQIIEDKKGKTSGIILQKLKDADKNLFNYVGQNGKKRSDYASLCGWTDTRQPVVISKEEKQNIDKNYPNSYNDFLQTGSTTELSKSNYYICPKLWCEKSRVSISYGEKCPTDEDPIKFNKKYWGDDERTALTRGHYIGYLKDTIHPKNYCVPCCFKLQFNEEKKKNLQCSTNLNLEKNKPVEDDDAALGNEKYIKKSNYFPLENSRYGLISNEMYKIFYNDKTVCTGGLMENGMDCMLRKGITHGKYSFISCILSVLNLSNIKTIPDFIKLLSTKLTIDKYLSIENGKIIRLFINNNFDIYQPSNFLEFKSWFLKQDHYINNFNLYSIKKELEKSKTGFDNTSILYKSIMREFMIYNSYKHFIQFINDEHSIIDHRILLDLINIEHDFINKHRKHFAIIEQDPINDKAIILCPFNRNAKEFDKTYNSFIFLIKTNEYYEVLCNVKFQNGDIYSKYDFIYNETTENMRNFIDYYINNCGYKEDKISAENIILFLESTGYKIKSYVIDFTFRVCGVLITKNLYIPFKNKLNIYNIPNNDFIYYNDLVNFKCYIEKKEITHIFNTLVKHTEDTFYKVGKYIEKNSKIIAAKLKGDEKNPDIIIPLKLSDDDILYRTFEHDISILIKYEMNDKRYQFMKIINDNDELFNQYLKEVQKYIHNNDKIRLEIEFITSHDNPFPRKYKRYKLLNILNKIHIQHDKEFTNRFINSILTGFNISNVLIKNFKPSDNEFYLTQVDINTNVINDLIKLIQDPFTLLSEKLDEITDEYVFPDTELNKEDTIKELYINENTEYEPVPIMCKKMMKGYEIIENKRYNQLFIYTLFNNISKIINPRKNTNIELFKNIIKTRIISDFTKNKQTHFYTNPNLLYSYKQVFKLTKLPTKKYEPNIDESLEIFDTIIYYPSIYEINILANIIGINVIIIGNKTLRNPNQFIVMNRKFKYTLVLSMSYNRDDNYDCFQLYTKNRNIILFTTNDLPSSLVELIEKSEYKFSESSI